MNTPNPSEAREIAEKLLARAEYWDSFGDSETYSFDSDLLRQAAALLTRPTSTPPDAGDSAKLVSDAVQLRIDANWLLNLPHRTSMPRQIASRMYDAANWIERHATPAEFVWPQWPHMSFNENCPNCHGEGIVRSAGGSTHNPCECGKYDPPKMQEGNVAENRNAKRYEWLRQHSFRHRNGMIIEYGQGFNQTEPEILDQWIDQAMANPTFAEKFDAAFTEPTPENWQCEHVAYGKYIDDQAVVSCGASEPGAFKLYSCDKAPSSATSEAVATALAQIESLTREKDKWESRTRVATGIVDTLRAELDAAAALSARGAPAGLSEEDAQPIKDELQRMGTIGAPAGEAVAWLGTSSIEGKQLYFRLLKPEGALAELYASHGYTWQPLYASPHPIERQAGEFVSVPREPTTEMIYAGIEAMKKAPDLVGIVDNLLPEAVDCYKAMLAAAPAQAAQPK